MRCINCWTRLGAASLRKTSPACLDFIREGDTLVVTKLDRLARSTQHLLEIADLVKHKRADLHILNLNIETSSATGELLLTMIAAVATFEREMMLERQREGIAKAKPLERYKGRKPTARARAVEIEALKADGVRPVDICSPTWHRQGVSLPCFGAEPERCLSALAKA